MLINPFGTHVHDLLLFTWAWIDGGTSIFFIGMINISLVLFRVKRWSEILLLESIVTLLDPEVVERGEKTEWVATVVAVTLIEDIKCVHKYYKLQDVASHL